MPSGIVAIVRTSPGPPIGSTWNVASLSSAAAGGEGEVGGRRATTSASRPVGRR